MEAVEITPEQAQEEIRRRARYEMLKRGRAAAWKPLSGPQSQALDSLADETFYGGAAGGGKALSLDTLIPTPDGWTTMGEIEVGDVVFDEHGLPTTVVGVSEIMHDHAVYDVQFDDGTVITADAGHRWLTFDYSERTALARRTEAFRERRRATREGRGTGKRPDLAERNRQARAAVSDAPTGSVRTTAEIAASMLTRSGSHVNHAVPLAMPLAMPEVDLPVAPYTLGAWLGDGVSQSGGFTCADDGILDAIRADGYSITAWAQRYQYGIDCLKPGLRKLGLIGNKHIPMAYQRASYDQRLALLQGLVDTDGHVAERGSTDIQLTSERLLRDVWRLLMSLGIRATVTEGRAMLDGRDCGPTFRVKFTTAQPVARLPRKAERLPKVTRQTTKWRYIVGVRQVASVPVRCIAVDAPSHLYLASEAMVPTHNSDWLLGCAMTEHREAIVFRREYPQLRALVKRSREIVDGAGSFNQTDMIWHLDDGRVLEFGAVQHETDVEKYRGRPHDFIGFDEAANFTEAMVVFLTGWLRTTIPGQRCRVAYASNPPTDTDGEWLIRRFAPWLDEAHPNPAEPGELRWFATVDGKEVERPDGETFDHHGETIIPLSRTFIPALVGDNPYLDGTRYVAQLQAMPEPLRSQLLYGDFSIGLADHEWQAIPTAWVRAAQERWTPERPAGVPQDQIGADVAQGGADNTVIARRYGAWFSEPEVHPGIAVPDAQHNADHIARALADGGFAQIDSDGIGASTYHLLVPKVGRQRVRAFRGSAKTKTQDRAKVLKFANTRAAAYWALRDALDPAYGLGVALPPSRELRAELCSARYETQTSGIKIEDKDDIKERIGRSPDLADTYVMANWQGASAIGALRKSLTKKAPPPDITRLTPMQTNASERARIAHLATEPKRPERKVGLLGRRPGRAW